MPGSKEKLDVFLVERARAHRWFWIKENERVVPSQPGTAGRW